MMSDQSITREYSFEDDGFTILRNVFSEETLAPLRQEANAIIKYFEPGTADPFEKYYLKHRVDQGVLYDLYQRFPSFQSLANNKLILDTLEEALGPNIFMYENSLVYKPPGKRNGVPFHQDFISRPHEPIKFIVWMALDNVTEENGCLRVIPGSHRNGFLKWHRVKGETHHDRIVPGQFDPENAVNVLMNPGDVLIFNMLLVHGSNEAHVESPRRAYRVSYQNFDRIYTPRGTPIVMRGGTPDKIENISFENLAVKKGPLRKFINRVGRRLSEI
jgi:phytanoyl-CoA hydroxylase